MSYRPNREENEETIRVLVDRYPKCFFAEPRLRRPLKKNITADVQQDGFPATYELIAGAVEWYQSHFGYQYSLETGARRINLNGKEVGTVTEQEHLAAEKKIKEGKAFLAERKNATLQTLYAADQIRDDHLKKLDAPTMKAKAATTEPAPPAQISPELTRLHEALLAANAALTGPGDPELQRAMATAALGVMAREARRLMDATADSK